MGARKFKYSEMQSGAIWTLKFGKCQDSILNYYTVRTTCKPVLICLKAGTRLMFVSFFRKRVQSYCFMDLRQFPMDVQNCELSFQSCEYSLENIHFKHWDRTRFCKANGWIFLMFSLYRMHRELPLNVFSGCHHKFRSILYFHLASPGYIYDDVTNHGDWGLIGKISIRIAFSPLLF